MPGEEMRIVQDPSLALESDPQHEREPAAGLTSANDGVDTDDTLHSEQSGCEGLDRDAGLPGGAVDARWPATDNRTAELQGDGHLDTLLFSGSRTTARTLA